MPKLHEGASKVLLAAVCVFVFAGGARSQEAEGQQVFSSHCAACHGLDGRGGEHAPNIATNAGVQTMRDVDLERIVRQGIAKAGMPAFAGLLKNGEIEAVIGHLRTLQGHRSVEHVAGDAARGRALFFGSAKCGQCHTVNGQGGFLGADLSGFGKTHDAAAIREAILQPNKNLDPRHGTATVVTPNGRHLMGAIRNENNFSLQLQTADGHFYSFDKAKLTSVQYEARSFMPADYGETLGKAQLNDLIRFLAEADGAASNMANEDGDQ